MKRIIAVILAVVLVCALAACGSSKPNNTNNNNNNNNNNNSSSSYIDFVTTAPEPTESPDKEIVFGDMKITLPKGFVDNKALIPNDSDIQYYYSYNEKDIAFAALNEDISDFDNTQVQSLDDYLEIQHNNSKGKTTSDIKEDNGLKYFDYDYESDGGNGETYTYFSTAYESDDYYWFVQFITTKELYSEFKSDFLDWAHTVTPV